MFARKSEGASTFAWSSGATKKRAAADISTPADDDVAGAEPPQKVTKQAKDDLTGKGSSPRGSFTLLESHTGEENEDCVKVCRQTAAA